MILTTLFTTAASIAATVQGINMLKNYDLTKFEFFITSLCIAGLMIVTLSAWHKTLTSERAINKWDKERYDEEHLDWTVYSESGN